jgi:hypothetical protein
MNGPHTPLDELAQRRLVYLLLGIIALASLTARLAAVRSADRLTPFLSANDRSRWATIHSIVDYGTYEIDQVIARRGWNTIDKVRHANADGELRYYSSKPPLFPTLVAAPYWLVKSATGADLERQTFFVARILLFLTNVLPLALYLMVMCALIEHWAQTHEGKMFAAACVAFGTFITTFGITLNNHVPATIGVAVSVWAMYQIGSRQRRGPGWFLLFGAAAAWTAANELPALAWLVCAGLWCAWVAWRQTCVAFVPGALLVIVPFFAMNYAVHDSLRPAYMHRSAEDNWYDYEGTYWSDDARRGIDRGEPSRAFYALNTLVGHHGIFSLTPIWIMSLWGIARSLRHPDATVRQLTWATIAITLICWLFYVSRPLIDRNYGGVSCGFRWMFWFTPLWIVLLLPTADRWLQTARGRRWAIVCLGLSVFSTNYALMNPWVHPWIYQYWQSLGWIPR